MIPDHWTLRETGEYFELITDYVANGSFKSLSENVNYNEGEGHAVLIRLTDYKNRFDGEFITINKKAYDFLSKSHLNGGEIIIRPTFKNSNAYDYSKPATVIKNGEMYQTHPYSTARDYSKPSYRIERRD